jgi:outer membrane immunogenic protein
MKKLTLILTAATALISAPALAGDLGQAPVGVPIAAPVLQPNWTGFYIGIQGGSAFGDLDWNYATAGGVNLAPPVTANQLTSGWLIGGTAGANFQVGSSWVFGIEGDYAWADVTGSAACPNPTFSCQSKLESFGTARGRVGWSWGPGLIYGTGGAAFGDQHIRTVNLAGVGFPPTGTPTNGSSNFAVGWTAGGGMEFAFFGNWSAKVEALYFDLGTDNYIVDSPADQSVNASHSGVVVRGGINYRFNWGVPVVARY